VLWVWAGNSQTDKVFLDATQWWKHAEDNGFILVIPCEQYSNTSVSVSHRDSLMFFEQLRELVIANYGVDPTRFYSTGQSAGSSLSQNIAVALPHLFAAVASTSAPPSISASGTVTIDGTPYATSNQMIPNYLAYGFGDVGALNGTLWDGISNGLDAWASYFLSVNGLALADVDDQDGAISGWYDRFRTWTWNRTFDGTTVPVVRLSKNLFRSHNCGFDEMPMLWDFAKHYSAEADSAGNVVRYYSASAFQHPNDKVKIYP
jgi:hypothetical protein